MHGFRHTCMGSLSLRTRCVIGMCYRREFGIEHDNPPARCSPGRSRLFIETPYHPTSLHTVKWLAMTASHSTNSMCKVVPGRIGNRLLDSVSRGSLTAHLKRLATPFSSSPHATLRFLVVLIVILVIVHIWCGSLCSFAWNYQRCFRSPYNSPAIELSSD